jgi:hypothetical protein
MNIRNKAVSAKLVKNRRRSKFNVGNKKRIRKYPINPKTATSVAARFKSIFCFPFVCIA